MISGPTSQPKRESESRRSRHLRSSLPPECRTDMPHWFLAFALAAIAHPSIHAPDVDGVERRPLQVSKGHVAAVFFVTHDCPISNYYAHEIRRICDDFAARGLSCSLVYTDPTLSDKDARKHAQEYGHGDYPKI